MLDKILNIPISAIRENEISLILQRVEEITSIH